MKWLLVLLGGILLCPLSAETLRVGLATGFPPYQYEKDGRPAGLDVELTEALFKELGISLVWVQRPWDEVTAILRTSRDLDLVVGMEKTGDRNTLFLLGKTLYTRKNLLFLLRNSPPIQRLEDLEGRAVAGDRDAYLEVVLAERGLKSDIRLVRTPSKEEAFQSLVDRRVDAAIMPEAVGWTLARQAGAEVRTLDFGDHGSPVGIAFARGRNDLAERFNAAVDRLEKRGVLKAILARYKVPGGPESALPSGR